MIEKDEILRLCDYYFSVLVKKYMELEKTADNDSKLASLFRKVNYQDFADAFSKLKDIAQKSYDVIAKESTLVNDYGKYRALLIQAKKSYSFFLLLLEKQIELYKFLANKANAKGGSMGEYKELRREATGIREMVEKQMQEFQKEYSDILCRES
jgi:hypothetical protein